MFSAIVKILSKIFSESLAIVVTKLLYCVVIVIIMFLLFKITSRFFKLRRVEEVEELRAPDSKEELSDNEDTVSTLFNDAPYKLEPKDVNYIED